MPDVGHQDEEKAKKEEQEPEGIAEGAIRKFGFGGLLDIAKRSSAFRERLRATNEQIEENLRGGSRRSLRPHLEAGYSVRHIVEDDKPKSVQKSPTRKIVPKEVEKVESIVDIFDEGDHLRVIVELPGVEQNDIRTEVKGTALMIMAESVDRKYSKRVDLPAAVMGEPTATYRHGVLEVRLKKAKAVS